MRTTSFYVPSFEPYTHIVYSFLTLSDRPDPEWPPLKEWNGKAITETMTLKPLQTVMNAWDYDLNWMKFRINALMSAAS